MTASEPGRQAFTTRAIHAGPGPDPTTGAIVQPIVQSTTYVQAAVGVHKGHTYSRASNPTVAALEARLGALEDAPPGVCLASGMAATTALVLAMVKGGEHVVCSDVVYGGTVRLLTLLLKDLGISTSFVDTASPAAVAAAIKPNTKLVFIETPANPTLKLTDIAVIARVCSAAGVPLAVDNTFLTAALQRPLELGADISLYSTTKYLEGHNSTIGGAIVTRDVKLLDKLRFVRKTIGANQSPFEAWLTLRGITTLVPRMRVHCENALAVASWLERDARVENVMFPGLASFPQHELALRQQTGPGGIIAFTVRGGTAAGIALMNNVKLCSLAENLGAVETLVTHPASMTHGDVPAATRSELGISDGLVRLSVGLEDAADLIADIDRALTAAVGPAKEGVRTTVHAGVGAATSPAGVK